MDDAILKQFSKKLEAERTRIESELSSLGVKNTNSPEGWEVTAGDIDTSATEQDEIADRHEEMEERSEELDALKIQLKDTEDALKKVEDGTYGICEVGQEEIEEDRLAANPAARTCKAHME